MRSCALNSFTIPLLIFACLGSAERLLGQPVLGKAAAFVRVEPGLETAVKWMWHVAPSEGKDWGYALPTPTPSPTPATAAATPIPTPEVRPTLYEVKHGDALILIAHRFDLTVEQLKSFNGLKTDLIRVGQKLKIPTLAEVKAAAAAAAAAAVAVATPTPKKHKSKSRSDQNNEAQSSAEFDPIRLQIFLDKEQFSAGPIAAEAPAAFSKVVLLYENTHEDTKDDAALLEKARASVVKVFTHYKLRPEDFRFIEPPAAPEPVARAPVAVHGHPAKRVTHALAIQALKPLTYDDLISAPTLVYRTPWAFVAERFHCQQAYLRFLNDKLPPWPSAGMEFQVPDVVPFEIEKAFDPPIQPQTDSNNPVTASVVGLSQLNIYRNGKLIALFPLSPARPGLHGRGTWTILDAILRPRLTTSQELRPDLIPKPPQAAANPSTPMAPSPATPSPSPAPSGSVQSLAAGPRNPVGILWINLQKGNTLLPYGLHGTSIPDQMFTEESLGGFRLANWDIIRALHCLPSGTPLEWK